MTSHPSLSPEERVSLSDPLEDSMIAGFVAVAWIERHSDG